MNFDHIIGLSDLTVEQHNAFMADSADTAKYLTAIMTLTIKQHGCDDGKLKPLPA